MQPNAIQRTSSHELTDLSRVDAPRYSALVGQRGTPPVPEEARPVVTYRPTPTRCPIGVTTLGEWVRPHEARGCEPHTCPGCGVRLVLVTQDGEATFFHPSSDECDFDAVVRTHALRLVAAYMRTAIERGDSSPWVERTCPRCAQTHLAQMPVTLHAVVQDTKIQGRVNVDVAFSHDDDVVAAVDVVVAGPANRKKRETLRGLGVVFAEIDAVEVACEPSRWVMRPGSFRLKCCGH